MRERDLRALEFDKVLALVMGFAASAPGREMLGRLRPATSPETVRASLRATAGMAELRQRAGALPIREFPDLRGLLLAAAREGAVLDGGALVQIRDFALDSRQLASFLRARAEPYPRLAALARGLLAPRELADALLKALAGDGGLLDDASPELLRLRNLLRAERVELEARLLRALSAPGMEAFVSDHLVTVRNRRFVLPLKLNYAERLEGIVQDRSVSGETLFVEPMWAVEINNRLMMLESGAEAEERRILAALTALVRGYGAELTMTFEAMVELDALNARAVFAEHFGCTEPEIGTGEIELAGARHPLLVTSGREVVPIDVQIPREQRGIVISGPNAGGKTVALKTIGLLSLMAQAGLLLPARAGSRIAVFRGIFADIGDEQSIETNLSTFSGHIANLAEILASLAAPALVILDEPGAGTDPAEGSALAVGLMNHLAARRCIAAIATHSTAVKLHAYSRPDFEVAAVDFDPERLVPLYSLKPRTMGRSYGLAVARRLGLPEEVIRAAEAAMGQGALELERSLERLEAERARLVLETERLRELEAKLARAERDLAETLARGKEGTERARAQLRGQVEELIRGLRREGDELLREIKSRAGSRRDLSAFLARAGERLEAAAPQDKTAGPAGPEALKAGDQVELGGIRGELLVLEPGRAVVARGSLRIEVSPERLRRLKGDAARPDRGPSAGRITAVTVEAASDEAASEGGGAINLIGMRAAEALGKLERFLDQAYLANRREVRIIHGIGSGALRKAVLEYLGSSPYCAGWREAEPGHGGAGATIVQLGP